MNEARHDDSEIIIATSDDGAPVSLDEEIGLKTRINGDLTSAGTRDEHLDQPAAADHAHHRQPADLESERPAKPAGRPWGWILLGAAILVGLAVGVPYYLYSLKCESTDDAFIDGHVIAVSPRVAGHVAKVHVIDNQLVKNGDLLAELDPRDFQARLDAAQAAVSAARAAVLAAQAGHKSRSIGTDVTKITATAGLNEASADVEGAQAAVTTAEAAVDTAKSQEIQAQAQLAAVQAAEKQAEADLQAAEARQQRAETFWKRIAALVPQRAASQDTLDEAIAAKDVAQADVSVVQQRITAQKAAVHQAEAAVAAAHSGVLQAESVVKGRDAALERARAQHAAAGTAPEQVEQSQSQTNVAGAEADRATADAAKAEAEAHQAGLNLSYTKIYAPIAGHVTRKSVEEGTYVQVGQPLLALVDPDVWVIANFKETQLAKMQPGQPVTVTIDARPGLKLAAHVDSIQRGSGARFSLLPPENATGNYVKVVQRVPVKIVFNDPEQVRKLGLGPGMSVNPTVKVDAPGTKN